MSFAVLGIAIFTVNDQFVNLKNLFLEFQRFRSATLSTVACEVEIFNEISSC